MGHWTHTGVEPRDYGDDDASFISHASNPHASKLKDIQLFVFKRILMPHIIGLFVRSCRMLPSQLRVICAFQLSPSAITCATYTLHTIMRRTPRLVYRKTKLLYVNLHT